MTRRHFVKCLAIDPARRFGLLREAL